MKTTGMKRMLIAAMIQIALRVRLTSHRYMAIQRVNPAKERATSRPTWTRTGTRVKDPCHHPSFTAMAVIRRITRRDAAAATTGLRSAWPGRVIPHRVAATVGPAATRTASSPIGLDRKKDSEGTLRLRPGAAYTQASA
jgi:hypothetical protein